MSVHPVTTAVTDARLAEILTARWSDGEHAHGSEIESCLLELQRLRASSTASEKDAARYQWLREQMHIAGAAIVEVLQPAGDWGNSVTAESPEGLDAAIDAAMEKANG